MLLWQRNELMANFFLSASNSRSLYDRRSEELIISYVKTLRFTVGIINKSLIIPTDDLRPTSLGPNDIDNINEVAEINFGQKSENWLKEWREYNPLLCFLSK